MAAWWLLIVVAILPTDNHDMWWTMVIQSVISSGVIGHLNSGIAASKLPTAANVTVGGLGGLGGAVGGVPITAFMSAMRSERTTVLAFSVLGFKWAGPSAWLGWCFAPWRVLKAGGG